MLIMAKEQLSYLTVFYNSLTFIMPKRFELVIQFPLFHLILRDLVQSLFVGRRTMKLPTWVAREAVLKT